MALLTFLREFLRLCVLGGLVSGVSGFDLTILHTNDIHARIEETNKYSGACTDPDGKCYGGVARLKTKVDQFRSSQPNTLLLDAGDQYQGSILFSYFGGIVNSVFMNLVNYDIMVSVSIYFAISTMPSPTGCFYVFDSNAHL